MRHHTRREFIKSSVAAAATGALLPAISGCSGSKLPARRPNLLFVFPDQMRAQAVGFMGEDPAITPKLDAMSTGTSMQETSSACTGRPWTSRSTTRTAPRRLPLFRWVPQRCS